MHVGAGIQRIIGKAYTAALMVLPAAYHRPYFILIIQKSAQAHSESPCYLDERSQRRNVYIALNPINLLFRKSCTLDNIAPRL